MAILKQMLDLEKKELIHILFIAIIGLVVTFLIGSLLLVLRFTKGFNYIIIAIVFIFVYGILGYLYYMMNWGIEKGLDKSDLKWKRGIAQ